MSIESQQGSEIEWTVDLELKLLSYVTGNVPAGINRHFLMAFIHDKFTKSINKQVTSGALWKHLGNFYDLNALNAAEILLFLIEEKEFELPFKDFNDIAKKRLGIPISCKDELTSNINLVSNTKSSSPVLSSVEIKPVLMNVQVKVECLTECQIRQLKEQLVSHGKSKHKTGKKLKNISKFHSIFTDGSKNKNKGIKTKSGSFNTSKQNLNSFVNVNMLNAKTSQSSSSDELTSSINLESKLSIKPDPPLEPANEMPENALRLLEIATAMTPLSNVLHKEPLLWNIDPIINDCFGSQSVSPVKISNAKSSSPVFSSVETQSVFMNVQVKVEHLTESQIMQLQEQLVNHGKYKLETETTMPNISNIESACANDSKNENDDLKTKSYDINISKQNLNTYANTNKSSTETSQNSFSDELIRIINLNSPTFLKSTPILQAESDANKTNEKDSHLFKTPTGTTPLSIMLHKEPITETFYNSSSNDLTSNVNLESQPFLKAVPILETTSDTDKMHQNDSHLLETPTGMTPLPTVLHQEPSPHREPSPETSQTSTKDQNETKGHRRSLPITAKLLQIAVRQKQKQFASKRELKQILKAEEIASKRQRL